MALDTDDDVTLSNSADAENNDFVAATKYISGAHFPKIILYDSSGIEIDLSSLLSDGLTETTFSAVDFATQTTLAALLTELQAKADLGETQPISAASLPLPSGAATAAKQLADGHSVTVIGEMVTYTHTRPSINDSDGTEQVIASNASRKAGSYLINNTSRKIWLDFGADAVASQCIPVGAGMSFIFNTTQEIRCFQDSGGAINLDVYEAT